MQNAAPSHIKPAGYRYPVTDLMFVSKEEEENWIVENLIRPGDQVLLAGAPKSGKSLLGLQLALYVAIGGNPKHSKRRYMFAQGSSLEIDPATGKPPPRPIQVTKPRKVLYLSLEMGQRSVSGRLRKQLAGLGYRLPDATAESTGDDELKTIPLFHVFELPARKGSSDTEPRRSLNLVAPTAKNYSKQEGEATFERTPDFEDLKALISETNPELVVIDTLIQMHQLNENSNIEMKAVIQAVRAACVRPAGEKGKEDRIAHVVLHHLRKEGPQSSGQPGAEGMRGAGSIHSEADLVLTIKQWGPQWILQTSARDVSVDDMAMWRDDESLLFWSELKTIAQGRYPTLVATLMHGMLSDEALIAAHPAGFTKDEATLWFQQKGSDVAKEKHWKHAITWESNRIDKLLKRLVDRDLIQLTPGGGKGKKTLFMRLPGEVPEYPKILAAFDGLAYRKKRG